MSRTRLMTVCMLAGVLALVLVFVPGCSKDSSSPTGTSGTITVTGRVVSALLRPVASAPVVITGLPATTTDANGSFTISGVTPPYDVTVVISATKLGITYRGLTRSNPTLLNLFSSPAATNNATVSGTVSGGAGYPLPALHSNSIVYVSPDASGGSSPNSGTGAYTLSLSWDGATTTTGTLHALQWENSPAGLPQSYKGYASKTGVIVSAGGSFAGQNLALSSVTGGTVSGTVTTPATVTLATKALSLSFSSDRSITLGSESGSAAAFTYNVPTIAGTTIRIAATGSGGGGISTAAKTGIAVGATGVSLSLPEVPQLSLPVDAATNVSNTTPFSWTAVPSMIYLSLFNGPTGDPDFLVISGTPSSTIPDLTALGLGLPTSTTYSWGVYVFGPFASIDAAAGSNGFVPVGDSQSGVSSTRTFVTSP